MTADIVGGVIYFKAGPRIGFFACFMISIVGSAMMIVTWDDLDLLPIFIMMAKFGISANFNMCYLAFVQLIPTMYNTTVFGLCNVLARIITFMSPQIAEYAYPTPITISIASVGIGALFSLLIVSKLPTFV